VSQREVSARSTAVWHTFPGARRGPRRAGTWPGEPGLHALTHSPQSRLALQHRTNGGSAHVETRTVSLENRRCARRVRQEVRDGVAVAAFSAVASLAVSLALTLVLALIG
jgi:hypothetical protein